ncbi:damage-inducible protein DinB [Fictibacillus phosphorivorans]|uniref:Damage-inducible protein DinB n=1 Tax=Fictibacillus phosphorivorans TaxID=1221500 RepID=A0A163RM78_9BACL|nr:DinB family protein [Fictibacillus phosphorivorans]KZE67155.1 damage-inducible protein DinB [Fictibacillus phosphorivorans]
MTETYKYADYYKTYVKLVPKGDMVQILEDQMRETVGLMSMLSEEKCAHRYAAGKWSIKEVIGHVVDTERIMSYRLLSIARGDRVSLPGYDENAYVEEADFDSHSMKRLLEHFVAVRQATIQLINSLPKEARSKIGTANGHEVSVSALMMIIAGHELHHRNIILERYLAKN